MELTIVDGLCKKHGEVISSKRKYDYDYDPYGYITDGTNYEETTFYSCGCQHYVEHDYTIGCRDHTDEYLCPSTCKYLNPINSLID